MLRNVFLRTLYDQRRSLMWWASGILAYALMIAAFYPSIQAMPSFNDFVKAAPKELMAAFVGNITDLVSPVGFLNSQIFFLIGPLLLLLYAVGQGSSAIAGEEERGTLDLLLANPLPRWRVVAEKFGAMVVGTLGLALMLWLGLAAGALWAKMNISMGRIAEATLATALLGLVFGTLGLALGSATGNRGLSNGVTSTVALAAYLLNALAPLSPRLEPYRKLSPFYYYIGADPLVNGLNLGHVAVLLGLIVVLLAVALWAFQRRDVAV
jgi:ABC-2 type transport system permease protein